VKKNGQSGAQKTTDSSFDTSFDVNKPMIIQKKYHEATERKVKDNHRSFD